MSPPTRNKQSDKIANSGTGAEGQLNFRERRASRESIALLMTRVLVCAEQREGVAGVRGPERGM